MNGVLRVCEAVALGDHLGVEEFPVREVHVPEEAAVPISVPRVGVTLEPDELPFGHALREGGRLAAKALNRLVRMDGLGRIDANESDLLCVPCDADLDGVTVDNTDAADGVGPGEGCDKRERKGEAD